MDDDPIMKKNKAELRTMIQEKRAKFKYATCDIIYSLACCIYFCPIKRLRNMRSTRSRNVMRYKIGEEKMYKELDVANILLKLRQLSYFMKMMLDKDQRRLLKLRSSRLIASDENEEVSMYTHKKIVNE